MALRCMREFFVAEEEKMAYVVHKKSDNHCDESFLRNSENKLNVTKKSDIFLCR